MNHPEITLPFRAKLGCVDYLFRWGRRDMGSFGLCDSPHKKGCKHIIIRRFRNPEDAQWLVEWLIHESVHGLQWHLDEEYVHEIGVQLHEVLTKAGVPKPEFERKIHD